MPWTKRPAAWFPWVAQSRSHLPTSTRKSLTLFLISSCFFFCSFSLSFIFSAIFFFSETLGSVNSAQHYFFKFLSASKQELLISHMPEGPGALSTEGRPNGASSDSHAPDPQPTSCSTKGLLTWFHLCLLLFFLLILIIPIILGERQTSSTRNQPSSTKQHSPARGLPHPSSII